MIIMKEGNLLVLEQQICLSKLLMVIFFLLNRIGNKPSFVIIISTLALSRLVRSHKCLHVTEDVEYQSIVMRYLRYINFWIQKQKEDIFMFYAKSESYDLLWELFCRELETSLLNLKKLNKKKYLKQIQTAEDEITHFRWVHKWLWLN